MLYLEFRLHIFYVALILNEAFHPNAVRSGSREPVILRNLHNHYWYGF